MVRLIIFLSLILFIRLFLFYSAPYIIKNSNFSTNQVSFLHIFEDLRERIGETFHKRLPKDEAGLLAGIILGTRENLDRNFLNSLKKTGALHVIAASGMNVSMLASLLLTTFTLFLRRQIALLFTSFGLVFYVALAGFEPSIIRAATMAIFAYGAGLFGRQNTSLLALFFTAFIMVFISPQLIIDIGFQLSFAATCGIILFDPLLRKTIFGHPLFEDLRTTLSAQIATIPILLFFFSSYSPISILVNLLVLWTVPPLMILGGAAAFISFISPLLSTPFLFLSLPLLSYFKTVTLLLSDFAPEFTTKNLPLSLVFGYYLINLSLALFIYKRYKINA